MNRRELLDPTAETQAARRPLLPRPRSLDGLAVGFLDISKPRGDLFLDCVQPALEEKGAKVLRYAKPTFARTAPEALYQEIVSHCDLVIEALAD